MGVKDTSMDKSRMQKPKAGPVGKEKIPPVTTLESESREGRSFRVNIDAQSTQYSGVRRGVHGDAVDRLTLTEKLRPPLDIMGTCNL